MASINRFPNPVGVSAWGLGDSAANLTPAVSSAIADSAISAAFDGDCSAARFLVDCATSSGDNHTLDWRQEDIWTQMDAWLAMLRVLQKVANGRITVAQALNLIRPLKKLAAMPFEGESFVKLPSRPHVPMFDEWAAQDRSAWLVYRYCGARHYLEILNRDISHHLKLVQANSACATNDGPAVLQRKCREALPLIVQRFVELAMGGNIAAARLVSELTARKTEDRLTDFTVSVEDRDDLLRMPYQLMRAISRGSISPQEACAFQRLSDFVASTPDIPAGILTGREIDLRIRKLLPKVAREVERRAHRANRPVAASLLKAVVLKFFEKRQTARVRREFGQNAI